MTISYDSITFNIVSNPIQVGGLLNTWTDIAVAKNVIYTPTIDPTSMPPSFLIEAFDQITPVPDVGDKHPIYDRTYCTDVRADMISGKDGKSPVDVQFEISWACPNSANDDGTIPRNHIDYDNYQSSQIRNYDVNGQQTVVKFTYNNTPNGLLDGLTVGYKAADIRVPQVMHGLRIQQYESTFDTPAIGAKLNLSEICFMPTGLRQPFYNDAEWGGFIRGQILFVGRKATQMSSTPLHLMEYQFLVNPEGWDKFFALFQDSTGVVPNTIAQINPASIQPGQPIPNPLPNGLGAWDMLDSGNFSIIFAKIQLPGT